MVPSHQWQHQKMADFCFFFPPHASTASHTIYINMVILLSLGLLPSEVDGELIFFCELSLLLPFYTPKKLILFPSNGGKYSGFPCGVIFALWFSLRITAL